MCMTYGMIIDQYKLVNASFFDQMIFGNKTEMMYWF